MTYDVELDCHVFFGLVLNTFPGLSQPYSFSCFFIEVQNQNIAIQYCNIVLYKLYIVLNPHTVRPPVQRSLPNPANFLGFAYFIVQYSTLYHS